MGDIDIESNDKAQKLHYETMEKGRLCGEYLAEMQKEVEFYKGEKEKLLTDFKAIMDMKDRQIDIMNQEMQKQRDDLAEFNIYKEKCSVLEARISKAESALGWKIAQKLRILGSKLRGH